MALTTEQKTLLTNELTNDPDNRGYATDIADGNTGYVWDKLASPFSEINVPTWVTDLTLMALLDLNMYRSVMSKLEAIATQDIVVRDFLARLRGTGADIGLPKTVEMIDQLTALPQGAFTTEEATALKAISLKKVSFIQKNQLDSVVTGIQVLYDEGIL